MNDNNLYALATFHARDGLNVEIIEGYDAAKESARILEAQGHTWVLKLVDTKLIQPQINVTVDGQIGEVMHRAWVYWLRQNPGWKPDIKQVFQVKSPADEELYELRQESGRVTDILRKIRSHTGSSPARNASEQLRAIEDLVEEVIGDDDDEENS